MILDSLKELCNDTNEKAWMFKIEKTYFYVSEYLVSKKIGRVSIWQSTRLGKRKTSKPIFSLDSVDHIVCVHKYIDSLMKEQNSNDTIN